MFGGLAIAKGIGLAVDGIQALGNFALGGVDKLDALGDATARLDTLAKGLGDTATTADLTRFGVDKGEQAASRAGDREDGEGPGADRQAGQEDRRRTWTRWRPSSPAWAMATP